MIKKWDKGRTKKKYSLRLINKLLSLFLLETETCILSLSRQTRNIQLKIHHKLLRDYVYKWCPLLDMSSQLTFDYHHDLRMFQPFQRSCSNIFLLISMLLLYIQKINADAHRFHLIARIDQMFERVEIVNCFIKLIISARHSLFILHHKI